MIDYVELWEERAAIIEHDAKIDRKRAEVMALYDIAKRYGDDAKKQVQAYIRSGRK